MRQLRVVLTMRLLMLLAMPVCLPATSAFADPSSVSQPRGSQPRRTPTFTVIKATVSTAGPYGDSWYVTILPDGEASLKVYYSVGSSGSILGRFSLPDERIEDIARSIETEGFFTLPAEFGPQSAPLHQPDLWLEIAVGDKRRKVNLYDPDQIATDPRAKRLLAIWDQVFGGLPFKPKW
jgi:hypothetical protein